MNWHNSKMGRCALAAIALCAMTGLAQAQYEQLPAGPVPDGEFSDGTPPAVQFYDQRMADDFTLGAAASIVQVQWWGGAENFGPEPNILLNTASFVISFYDQANPVEPPIYTETIPLASITATLTGNTNVFGGLEYHFSANLATPVAIPAGVAHSIHIGAVLIAPGGNAFMWHFDDGSAGNNSHSADGLTDVHDGTWVTTGLNDFAFRLLAPSPGRCCTPTGTCTVEDEEDCLAPNVFGGFGSNCDGTPCVGRCCVDTTCSLTGSGQCAGTFGGLGTNCTGDPCSPQSFNIDYTTGLGTPTSDYPAAGLQPGVWNNPAAGVTTPQPLVNLAGAATSVTIRMTTANGAFTFNNAGTTGNDEALMDDILDLGFQAADTFVIENLGDGPYSVITYAWAPDSALFITSVDVNGLGAQNVGGPWPGMHEFGITYAQHNNVFPVGGTITIDTVALTGSSGSLNGIQLIAGGILVGRCCDPGGGCTLTLEADCTGPSTYGGVGTTCAGDPCRGRCCDPGGSCELTGPADCVAPSVFGALGTNCNGDPCRGRCCAPGGTCELTGPADCTAPSVFGGLGSNCEDVTSFGNPDPIPVAMPPAGAAPPSFINVADHININDLNVRVLVQHTWRNDAILQLQGPDGTIVPLTGTTAGICGAEDNINAIFDDEGAAVNCASANLASLNPVANPPDHIFTNPAGGLAAFDGQDAFGTWTLLASDIVAADVGSVLDWELIIDSGQPCVGGEACNCFGDLTGDLVVDGRDVNAMAACIVSGGPNCGCGDMNHSGGVTSDDVTAFVTAVLTSTCGAPPP